MTPIFTMDDIRFFFPQENPCTHPVVIFRDSAFSDVEGLVRYIYRGEVDVATERLQSFLRTAELLKIKGLADQNLSSGLGNSSSGGGGSSSPEQELESAPKPETPAPAAPVATVHQPQPVAPPPAYQPHPGLMPSFPAPAAVPLPLSSSPMSSQHIMQQQLQAAAAAAAAAAATVPSSVASKISPSCIKVPIPPLSSSSGSSGGGGSSQQQLKRTSHFSKLAQYITNSSASGVPASGSPPLSVTAPMPITSGASTSDAPVVTPAAVPSKRRKTTPRKHDQTSGSSSSSSSSALGAGNTLSTPPHYSGSTSSVTASPASPDHSHSTEGGDGSLEICEDIDR